MLWTDICFVVGIILLFIANNRIMKLISILQQTSSNAACVLFKENGSFFALGETTDAILNQFKCKNYPIECCISSVEGVAFNGNFFAEVVMDYKYFF